MPGKLQTDNLEKRFGSYRKLSGCNYYISYQQILESEKKLRIRHIVKHLADNIVFESKSNGTLGDLILVNTDLFSDVLTSNYLEEYEKMDNDSNIYVCGYAAYSISKKIKCKYCIKLILEDKGQNVIDNDYFNYLQRGGLVIPSDQTRFILYHMSAIFHYICDYKKINFMKSVNQKGILCSLTYDSLSINDQSNISFGEICSCGASTISVFIYVFSIMANILLNNFRKKENNYTNSRNDRSKLQKFISQ